MHIFLNESIGWAYSETHARKYLFCIRMALPSMSWICIELEYEIAILSKRDYKINLSVCYNKLNPDKMSNELVWIAP